MLAKAGKGWRGRLTPQIKTKITHSSTSQFKYKPLVTTKQSFVCSIFQKNHNKTKKPKRQNAWFFENGYK